MTTEVKLNIYTPTCSHYFLSVLKTFSAFKPTLNINPGLAEDFPRQSCSASAFPGEERLVAGLPTRGCPGSRYLRALAVRWLEFGKMHWDAKKAPLCTEKVEK